MENKENKVQEEILKLMRDGWNFSFFNNELDSFTAIARKGDEEIVTDEFKWYELTAAIVEKVIKSEQ